MFFYQGGVGVGVGVWVGAGVLLVLPSKVERGSFTRVANHQFNSWGYISLLPIPFWWVVTLFCCT